MTCLHINKRHEVISTNSVVGFDDDGWFIGSFPESWVVCSDCGLKWLAVQSLNVRDVKTDKMVRRVFTAKDYISDVIKTGDVKIRVLGESEVRIIHVMDDLVQMSNGQDEILGSSDLDIPISEPVKY